MDVLFYYLRKKGKVYSDSCVKYTTTDNQFDQRIQALYKKFLSKNKDYSLISVDHSVAEYILGYYMPSNTSWYLVDEVMFPIHIAKEKHWILGRLNFKERCIYIYNSLRCAKSHKLMMEVLSSYSVLLPVFFELLDVWGEHKDIDMKSEFYASKKLLNTFEVVSVDDIPSQENT